MTGHLDTSAVHLQLEFVNGGYVQHDEATAHYVAQIDQTTRGHRCRGCSAGLQ